MKVQALVLVNIRSAYNVGAMFRTADAAGVSQLVLVGYTPHPIDRFLCINKEIAKTALGAEKTIRWSHHATLEEAVSMLHGEGYVVVGLEQDERAEDYRAYRPEKPVALVLGNEVTGLTVAEREICDALIEIPMHGAKESLNVSVACGVALFRLNDAQ